MNSGTMSAEKDDEFAAWLSGHQRNTEKPQHFNALLDETEILKNEQKTLAN